MSTKKNYISNKLNLFLAYSFIFYKISNKKNQISANDVTIASSPSEKHYWKKLILLGTKVDI
jgi:hypothetical protein